MEEKQESLINIQAVLCAPIIKLPLNVLKPDKRIEIHLGQAEVETSLADRSKPDEIYDKFHI